MKNKKLIGIGAAVVVGLLVVFFVLRRHGEDAAQSKPQQVPALTVTTVKPTAASLAVTLTANGNVAAWQEASIGSESNGLRLTEVRVNVGDTVRKGEVLAVFAEDTVNADVAQARAALQEAQAAAAEASANAGRARSLQNTGALSAQQISQFTTAEATANARIAAARATLQAQELRLRFTHVLAPDSGVISARGATVGAVVPAGTELFRMIRQGRLEWRAEVPSAQAGRVKIGAPASVLSATGAELKGKVRMVAPTVDPQTRNTLVYVDLPPVTGPNAPFKTGMFASGRFDLGASSGLTLPQQAVTVRDGFSYVFRLQPDLHVAQVKVQTGRRMGERIEVLGGVGANDDIVASGAGFLNDGDLVRKAPAAK
ncbi:MAG: efflux RND transporter periplasmic adaptor subunit [Telluria sp.]